MSLNDHPMVIVVPLLLTGIGLAWTIGYNTAENRAKTAEAQLAAYETSTTLQLPQLLTDLREASMQLSFQLETTRALAKTKEELDAAQERIATLEPLKPRLHEAETALKSLYSEVERFTLRVGESRSLLGYEIPLALHRSTSSEARVLFDNKSATLEVGGEVTAARNGKTCRLRLHSVSGFPAETADFIFIVSK